MAIEVKLTELAKELMAENLSINFVPTRATEESAGFDLSACIENPITIGPGEIVKIPTGAHIYLNEDVDANKTNIKLCGLYLPRSSSPNVQLTNTVGLLDKDYQGESFLKYTNRNDHPIEIQPGERIGQLVLTFAYTPSMVIVDSFDAVTERGEGGDGSTGK